MLNEEDILKIQHTNDELKDIISNSWNAIGIITLTGKFIYVNTAFSPILGYSNKELLNINFSDLITEKYKYSFKNLMKINITNKYKNKVKLTCNRNDGEQVTLMVTINLMKNKEYFVINVSDITQAESDNEILNKYVIQTHADLEGNIIEASDAFCRISGYTREELIGQPYRILKHPKRDKEIAIKLWKELKEANEYHGTLLNKKKNGDDFWVELAAKTIKNKYGDITGYTAVMFDISNEMILKSKVDESQNKLNIMGDTMRMVAHQWRQPLNAISLEIQNIIFDYEFEDTISTKDQSTIDKLKGTTKYIENLSAIINNFQDTSEIRENKTIQSSDVILDSAIKLAKIDNVQLIEQRDTNISFPTYLNELSNSIKHILVNAKEAITNNNISNGYIKTKTYKEDENIIFEISDNAGHISDDILDKIFTPYFSTKKEKNQVGLSLYNCKTIIELHLKGKIEVYNLDKNIVMFKISLPIGEKR